MNICTVILGASVYGRENSTVFSENDSQGQTGPQDGSVSNWRRLVSDGKACRRRVHLAEGGRWSGSLVSCDAGQASRVRTAAGLAV